MDEITNPRYEYNSNYPALRFEYRGKTIHVGIEQKMLGRGFDFVDIGGNDCPELETPVLIPADPENGRPLDDVFLHGFTNHPVILQLTKDFLACEDFKPGPIDLPQLVR